MRAHTHVEKLRSEASAPSVLETIQALQGQNRLAIHMWENRKIFTAPSFSFGGFVEDTNHIKSTLKHTALPLLSMTLLPPPKGSFKSVIPYCVDGTQEYGHCGYLVNIAQDQTKSPAIPRINEKGIFSSIWPDESSPNYHPYEKSLRLNNSTSVSEVAAVLARYPTEKAAIEMSFTDEGKQLAEQQLDAIAQYIQNQAIQSDEAFFRFNELLVCANKENICAIVFPYYNRDQYALDNAEEGDDIEAAQYKRTPLTQSQYDAVCRLTGALEGIRHARDYHCPLPVVALDMNGPETGNYRVIADTPAQCFDIVLDAIDQLQHNSPNKQGEHASFMDAIHISSAHVEKAVKDLVGVDVSKPLREQSHTIAAARTQLSHAIQTGISA